MYIKELSIRKTIKRKAFEEPKGTLAKALLFLFIIGALLNYTLIYLFKYFSINNNLINVLTIILLSPLFLNYINMFLKNSRDELISVKDLFSFKKYSLKFIYCYGLIILILYLINLVLDLIPVLGFILNVVLFIILFPAFLMIPYVFLEKEKTTFEQIVRISFRLVKHQRILFYGILLSFMPWFILGLFTLGILYIWLIPYILITVTYLYQYLRKNSSFKKENSLSNKIIIILFIISLVLLDIISFIVYPNSLDNFKNNLGIYSSNTNQSLIYGTSEIKYAVPKNYKLVNQVNTTKTYTNNDTILQYTLYFSSLDKVIKMDKDVVSDYKKTEEYEDITDKEFTLNLNGKNIKCYMYKLIKADGSKTCVTTAYIKKGNMVITVTLTKPNDISQNEIKKFIIIK